MRQFAHGLCFGAILLLAYFGLVLEAVSAQPRIDEQFARGVAEGFHRDLVRHRIGPAKIAPIRIGKVDRLYDSVSDNAAAYVITMEPTGFMVVETRTDTGWVLAYSLNQAWGSSTGEGDALYHLLMTDLAIRYPKSERPGDDRQSFTSRELPFRQWPADGTTSTGGWIETTWHQGSPFNSMCPIDPYDMKRSAVGCVATAMSQLVHHHRFMAQRQLDSHDCYDASQRDPGQINLDSDSARLDFPSFARLNEYLESIRIKYTTSGSLVEDEVAALNFACGISIKTKYSSNGSSTGMSLVSGGLVRDFGFYSARETDYTVGYAALVDNMMNGLPAVMGISNDAGLAHAVVVDGYNTLGYFHLNFGWGAGSPDVIGSAWYLLPQGMGAGYNRIFHVVHDIAPEARRLPTSIADTNVVRVKASNVGSVSQASMVVLRNSGAIPLMINEILSTGGFEVSLKNAPFSDSLGSIEIFPGDTVVLSIRCQVNTLGVISGLVLLEGLPGSCQAIRLLSHGLPAGATSVQEGTVAGLWTRAKSPYYVLGNITVPAKCHLTIEPGTEICFAGPYGLEIESKGKLTLKGLPGQMIKLYALDSTEGWRGISYPYPSIPISVPDTIRFVWLRDGNVMDGSAGGRNEGGALLAYGPICIENCLFENNRALVGGGLSVHTEGSIRNTIIRNNKATVYGGGILYRGSIWAPPLSLKLDNVTIVSNAVLNQSVTCGQGGGVWIQDGSVVIRNSILRHNSAVSGSELYLSLNRCGGVTSIDYSDVETNNQSWKDGYTEPGTFVWGQGNITADPLFSDPSSGDLKLLPASPCIDAGDPDPQYDDPEDASNRGHAAWPAQGTTRCDMGAYGGPGSEVKQTIAGWKDDRNLQSFVLAQNYPNPFNPSTTIRYGLPNRSNVTLIVYSMLGQVVAVLQKGEQEAGYHEAKLDGRNLASGVYFYRLQAGDFVQTHKLLLLK